MIFLVGEEPDVQRIPAHSWVLIEKSPVFRAMLTGPLAGSKSPLGRKRRRTFSGSSCDKNAASSLSTIPDNETEPAEDAEDKPIEFEAKSSLRSETVSEDVIPECSATSSASGANTATTSKALLIPTIVIQEDSEAEAEAEASENDNMMSSARSLVMPASTPNLMGGNKANPIPVSDVDGRTFDIVLR